MYVNTGSLLINKGGKVSDDSGFIGYTAGPGSVTVDGAGSSWSLSNQTYGLSVGIAGTGEFFVTNGGSVTSNNAWVGPSNVISGTGNGIATVDGAGSKWANTGSTFIIGQWSQGNGKLSVSDGGAVSSAGLAVYGQGLLTADVGKGSSLAVSSTLTNNGAVRLVAGAGAAAGTFTPITAATWTGTGTIQALGGVLNADHSVTVNPAVTGAAGAATTIDLSQTQRVLITDGPSNMSVGAGFQAATTSTSLSITASLANAAELSLLQNALGTGQSVLSGWTFSSTGYNSGDPVYLSLFAGSGQSLTGLTIWDFSNGSWAQVSPSDLAYDNTSASFTAGNLDDYAVTGNSPVPIPGAVWLLSSGLFALMGLRRRTSGKASDIETP